MSHSLREMLVDDLDAVLAIESSTHAYPWKKKNFESSLQSIHQCVVLEEQQKIKAYYITSTAADEAELLNITVAPEYQRQGLGRFLIQHICKSFKPSIQSLFLEVRQSNHNAIALYLDCGFNEVGVRPNYYPAHNNREDAIIMALSLSI